MKKTTPNVIYLLFLLLTLSLLACNGGAAVTPTESDATAVSTTIPAALPPTAVPEGLTLYEDTVRGIQLTYPADWHIEAVQSTLIIGSQSDLLSEELLQEPYGVMAINFFSPGEIGLDSDADSNDMAAYLASYIEGTSTEADILRQEAAPTTIANHDGAAALIQTTGPGDQPVILTINLHRSNQRMALVIGYTPLDNEAEFIPVINEISHSIVMREPDLAFVEGVVQYGDEELSRAHDDNIVYPPSPLPPAGGTHDSRWQTCGVYDAPIETKHALHSLEHGAVWITYQPDLPDTAVQQLRDLVWPESFLLLSPYPGQRSPIVLTAWGVQLEVNDVDDGRIAEFIHHYQVGPQTPEPGATCQQGVGTPLRP